MADELAVRQVPTELRPRYRRHLEEIDHKVVQMFGLVSEGIAAATDALLSGDVEGGRAVVARDGVIDSVYLDLERLVNQELALQAPVAADLRFMLSVLRIVPELERSHDLVTHIAQRTMPGLAADLTPRTRGLIAQMGSLGVEMWRTAGDAWFEHDGDSYNSLKIRDDEMDDRHAHLIAELASGGTSLPVAMDMALVARFYERLGDHAVNVARRIRYLADGE